MKHLFSAGAILLSSLSFSQELPKLEAKPSGKVSKEVDASILKITGAEQLKASKKHPAKELLERELWKLYDEKYYLEKEDLVNYIQSLSELSIDLEHFKERPKEVAEHFQAVFDIYFGNAERTHHVVEAPSIQMLSSLASACYYGSSESVEIIELFSDEELLNKLNAINDKYWDQDAEDWSTALANIIDLMEIVQNNKAELIGYLQKPRCN